MTMPNERTRSIKYAREFLRALLDPKQTPKVPRIIREHAYRVLRHFPGSVDITETVKKLPKIWGKEE